LRKPSPAALQASLPILFGYAPMGLAFGLLFGTLGYPWWCAGLSGLLVYAGAAQFLSVSLLASHAGLGAIFLATLVLNLRHVFYGFSLLDRYAEASWLKPYLIFGLTDETYSVVTTRKASDPRTDVRFCLELTALNHAYWTLSCAVGGWAGKALGLRPKGLEFVLTAMFVVLAVEQAASAERRWPFALAAAAAVPALVFQPDRFLIAALTLVFAGLLAVSLRGGPRA
jgi:4-azaleucine resistance transporter AzlC